MQIEIRSEGDIGIADISGEIDSKTAPQAQGELMPVIMIWSQYCLRILKSLPKPPHSLVLLS